MKVLYIKIFAVSNAYLVIEIIQHLMQNYNSTTNFSHRAKSMMYVCMVDMDGKKSQVSNSFIEKHDVVGDIIFKAIYQNIVIFI